MGNDFVFGVSWQLPERVGCCLTPRILTACVLALFASISVTSCSGDPIAGARPKPTSSPEPAAQLAEAEDPVWLSDLKGAGLVARVNQAPQSGLVGDSQRPGYLSDILESDDFGAVDSSSSATAGYSPSYGTLDEANQAAPAVTTVISKDYQPQHAAAAAAAVTARLPPAFSQPAHGSIILALEESEPETLQLGLRPIFSLQSPGEPQYQTVIIRGPPAAAPDTAGSSSSALQSQTSIPPQAAPTGLPSAGYRLQLASFKNRNGAEREASRLREAFEDLLSDRPLSLVTADLGDRGEFHRVQFSGYPSFGTAAATCSELKARGQACLVLKPL